MPPLTTAQVSRFLARIDRGAGPDGCWPWRGPLNNRGYGLYSYRSRPTRNVLTHRLAYYLATGVDPLVLAPEMDHKCHCRACCNPTHLRPATHKQNAEHLRGGRGASGERGVTLNRRCPLRPWAVSVSHNGAAHYGGQHATRAAAGEAARELRLRLFTRNDLDRT
jgi:hypothetical protein